MSLAPWILIVDDEVAMQEMLETILSSSGWTVRTAGDATQAIAIIESAQTAPGLVISDILMPGVDGLELTRRIVAKVPGIKVILISGHLTNLSWWPTDFREHRFVPKPFSPEQLLGAVRDAFTDSAAVD
jgi:DNA-binding NtrC family response regulator